MGPVKAEAATKKVKVVLEFADGTKKTWKTGDAKIKLGKKKLAYVYFGEYPQTEVTGKKLTEAIKNARYDENSIAKVKGVKYKRITRYNATSVFDSTTDDTTGKKEYYYDWAGKGFIYFKLEPIKWCVLSNKKGTVLLLSEYGLDDRKYNSEMVDITWADCMLRTWLNGTFLKSAFNTKERKLIKTSSLVNADTPVYGTKGGISTKDKVYLLSYDDILKYYSEGASFYLYDINRRCSTTDYAKAMGAYTADGDYENNTTREGKPACWWWLRSPGIYSYFAMAVNCDGYVIDVGDCVDRDGVSVRPALRLNLSSVIG